MPRSYDATATDRDRLRRAPANALALTKRRAVQTVGRTAAWALRNSTRHRYRPGVTVLTANWNSWQYLQPMLDITRAMSPVGTEFMVIDNGSTDGTVDRLRQRDSVRVVALPINFGHGVGLDIAAARVDTEYVAVLDVDAFPTSPDWLSQSIDALDKGAQIAGAHLHRNFIHPCFLVTRTETIHQYGLTFRPVGHLAGSTRSAPLFLDVAEAMAQRLIIRHSSSRILHKFEIDERRDAGTAGCVFGGLVYHNMYATQGTGKSNAPRFWAEAIQRHHPDLATTILDPLTTK